MSVPSASSTTPAHPMRILEEAWRGHWETRGRAWLEGEHGPVVEDSGRADVEPVAGGHALAIRMDGTQLGAPFSALGIVAFDGRRDRFTLVWTDSSTAAPFLAEGHLGDDRRTLRLLGRADGPGEADFDRWWRVDVALHDDGSVVQQYFDLWASAAGSLVFEIAFWRRGEGRTFV